MATGLGQIQQSNLFSLNAMRTQTNKLSVNLAQLSSGNRLVNGSIDPSGLAISMGFRSQMSGIDQAMYNVQDTTSLTQTADSALGTQQEVLGRMRDLAVRSANGATLTSEDQSRINMEFQSLSAELTRQGQSTNFNTKALTTDVAGEQYGTQTAQVGPDNNASNQVDVTINPSTAATLGSGAGNMVANLDVSTTAGAQNAISVIDDAIEQVSTQRANLGVQQRTFEYQMNDLSTQRINMAGANSRIADTDMALTAVSATTAQLLQQVSMAAMSQTKAQAYGVLKLIGA